MSALLCVALLAAAATPETKSVDAQCKAAARLDDASREQYRVFADISNAVLPAANDARGSWHEFKTREDLKKFAQTGNAPNTQASIWKAPDGTRIAQVYFQSDSGDWSQDVEYCFRPDGTLARLVGALSNYAADVEGERTIYFDTRGDVLYTTNKARSVETRKPLPKADGLDTPPIYPTFASLPFLVPKSRRAAPSSPPPATPREQDQPKLDSKGVSDYVSAQTRGVRSCYERSLADHPTLTGRLEMHWTIGGDGTTRNVTVEKDALHADAVAACLMALIAKWRFTPAPGDPVEVTFPFVF